MGRNAEPARRCGTLAASNSLGGRRQSGSTVTSLIATCDSSRMLLTT